MEKIRSVNFNDQTNMTDSGDIELMLRTIHSAKTAQCLRSSVELVHRLG